MFGVDITILAFIGLATLGAGGFVYALMYDRLASEAQQEKRLKSFDRSEKAKASKISQRINETARRRKTVQESLRELEAKQKQKHNRRIGLKKTIQQAGLGLSLTQFFLISIVCGFLCAFLALLSGASLFVSLGVLFVGMFGLPRWFVSFVRKRRLKAFLEEFPNAVDVIVRGVKAGLPLNDCLAIIAQEAKEPVRTEFAKIVEAQKMGIPLSEAIAKIYENMPLPESNFFAIVISIQQAAGGNLSEALGNLSHVLRDRKKMQAKIRAMSAEAKASAGIIGSLPFIVMLLVYLTTPDYISILFTHPTGNLVLLGAGIWMAIGIMVMRSMISFDF